MSWLFEDHPQITSSGSKLTVTDARWVNMEFKNRQKEFFAYWKRKNGWIRAPSEYYFKFTIKFTKGDIGVGLTTENLVKDGRMKGFIYNGSLKCGNCLLGVNFGEKIADDDVVGVLIKMTAADLNVYLYHIEEPLGLALHIKGLYPILPFVHLVESGEVEIAEPGVQPTDVVRKKGIYTGVEGPWKLVEVVEDEEVIEEFREWRSSLTIKLKGSRRFGPSPPHPVHPAYLLEFEVVNSIYYRLDEEEDGWSVSEPAVTELTVTDENLLAEEYLKAFMKDVVVMDQNGDLLAIPCRTHGSHDVPLLWHRNQHWKSSGHLSGQV